MKKLILCALVCTAVLTSCGSAKTVQPGAVFDYQKSIGEISGVWCEDGESYGVQLSFDSTENGSVLRTLTFTSPETLNGISVVDSGDHMDIGVGGMNISMEFAVKETMLRVGKMFCLDAADITDISADEGGTVITGKSEGAEWQVETDADGVPKKIIYNEEKKSGTFEVTELTETK